MNDLIQLLKSGGILRYRPALGFYCVVAGKSSPVAESTGKKAVQAGLVTPNGKDPHGVYLFALNQRRVAAMEGGTV